MLYLGFPAWLQEDEWAIMLNGSTRWKVPTSCKCLKELMGAAHQLQYRLPSYVVGAACARTYADAAGLLTGSGAAFYGLWVCMAAACPARATLFDLGH